MVEVLLCVLLAGSDAPVHPLPSAGGLHARPAFGGGAAVVHPAGLGDRLRRAFRPRPQPRRPAARPPAARSVPEAQPPEPEFNPLEDFAASDEPGDTAEPTGGLPEPTTTFVMDDTVPPRYAERAADRMLRELLTDTPWAECGMDFRAFAGRTADTCFLLPPADRAAYVLAKEADYASSGGPLRLMASLLSEGGSYRVLGSATREGETVARVRGVVPGFGVEYYDLLVRQDDGRYRVVDVYHVDECKWASETAGHRNAAGLALRERVMADLPEEARQRMRDMKLLNRIEEACDAGQGDLGLQLLEELPPELRRRRSVRRLRVSLAAFRGRVAFFAEQVQFRRAFPDDPAPSLVDFGAGLANGETDRLLRADAVLNGLGFEDPYRTALIGAAVSEVGDFAHARRRFEDAVRREPLNDDIYVMAADAFASAGAAALAAEWIRRADREFVIDWKEYPHVVHADRFVGTPEHEAITDYLGGRSPEVPVAEPPRVAAPPQEGRFRL